MTTATAEKEPQTDTQPPAGLSLFRQQDAIIDDLLKQSQGLTIAGVNDRKGQAEREAAAAAEREAARLKIEVQRPQREKFLAIADQIGKIVVPERPNVEMAEAMAKILNNAEAAIRVLADGLIGVTEGEEIDPDPFRDDAGDGSGE